MTTAHYIDNRTVKERPILFSAPMVRALLDGRKMQTRRIVKPQPDVAPGMNCERLRFKKKDGFVFLDVAVADNSFAASIYCPYGAPGDRLWVREGFCQKFNDDGFVYNSEGNLDPSCFWYRADGVEVLKCDGDGAMEYRKDGSEASPWKSPIHMPRHAARILLEVTVVRVERLQEISEEDAKAEGICKEQLPRDPDNFHPPGSYGYVSSRDPHGTIWPTAAEAYRELWARINGIESWETNPWVWVIEFRRLP